MNCFLVGDEETVLHFVAQALSSHGDYTDYPTFPSICFDDLVAKLFFFKWFFGQSWLPVGVDLAEGVRSIECCAQSLPLAIAIGPLTLGIGVDKRCDMFGGT